MARQGSTNKLTEIMNRLENARAATERDLADSKSVSERGRPAVLVQQLAAMIRAAGGDVRGAVEMLRAAAVAEEKLPFEFGPPSIEKPSYELLGEVLLAASDSKQARLAFEKALGRTPGRTASLVGLMRAVDKLGDRRKAEEIRAELRRIWHRADHPMSTEAGQ
jgi:hypothetical protein